MSSRVFLLGAYDRFNYGDLLFPIIVEHALAARIPGVEITAFALKQTDLSRFGAQKTLPIRSLFERDYVPAGSSIIVAGGGVLGASWASMQLHLSGRLAAAVGRGLLRVIGEPRFDSLCQRKFGSPSPWPWVVWPDDFQQPVKILYNAVGGSYLGNLKDANRNDILGRLDRAAHISVRDQETRQLLSPIDREGRVALAPDSAVLMSEFFPKEELGRRVSQGVRDILSAEKPYFCFQMDNSTLREQTAGLASVLGEIAHDMQATPLLLPIGRASGHEDDQALARIQDAIPTEVISPAGDIGVFDIMALIAGAQLFVGTSLHGAVTSQSFSVPHVALEGVTKLDHYQATWEIPAQVRSASLEQLRERVAEVLSVPGPERDANRERLIELSHQNFDRIAAVIRG